MSIPNPLLPQGSLLEQKAKGKPHLRVAYVIVGVHLVFLGGLLIQGCKPEQPTTATDGSATNDAGLTPPPADSLYGASTGHVSGQALMPPDTLTPAATQAVAVVPPGTFEPAPATREYVVLKGDSFYTIGKKFGVSANAIAKANPGLDATRLKIGDKLVIPAPAASTGAASPLDGGGADVYVVKSGDTLTKIAKTQGTTVTELRALNGLKTDRINVGQKLKVPTARPATAPAPTTPAGTPTPLPPSPGTGGTGNP